MVKTHKNQTAGRQALLDAGLKLFAKKGFAGTSVRDIASEAGVSIGLIRGHFGSKDGLRQAIDAYVLGEIHVYFENIYTHQGARAMEMVVEDSLEWLPAHRNVLMYLRMAILEKTPGSQALFDEVLNTMRQFIQNTENQGLLQPDLNEQEKDWAAIYFVFNFLGPAIIEPFSRKSLGASQYSKKMIAERNSVEQRLMTRGILKG